MNLLILNCDYDENYLTNGGQIIKRYLEKKGLKIIMKNIFKEEFPTEEELKNIQSIIITGSRASTYDSFPWITKLKELIRITKRKNLPLLGICFGFQIIAESFGGKVIPGNKMEEGFKEIKLENSKIFENLPKTINVYQSHKDIVHILPKEAIIISENHCIQAYQIGKVFAVQFHPEITPEIAKMMAIRDNRNLKEILNNLNMKYKTPLLIIDNFLKIN